MVGLFAGAVQQYLRTIHDKVLFNNAALLHGKCVIVQGDKLLEYCRVL